MNMIKRALASTVSVLAVMGTMCLGSLNLSAFADSASATDTADTSTSIKADTSVVESDTSDTVSSTSSITEDSASSSSFVDSVDEEPTIDPTDVPVHTDGTLFYSRDNDYFSFVGADDPHQNALQFKKAGYYDLVEYSVEHDLETGNYENLKLKSMIDGKDYASENKLKKADCTRYSAGDRFIVGRRSAFLLLYKENSSDIPRIYLVITDKSGSETRGSISCTEVATGENYKEYEFTIQYGGTNACINSIDFSRDGEVFAMEQATSHWGSPCTFRRKFYAKGNYKVTAYFSGAVCSSCSFTIGDGDIDDGAVVPTVDTEDATPPNISYSVSPNSTGLVVGSELIVTVTTDEPATINFNGMSSEDWVTSWDFPVYVNGSWLCVASDRNHNGNSLMIDVTNFGDGTTNYSAPEEPGNPLEGHDPDEFWNDVDSEGAYDENGRRVRNERLRRTKNGSRVANPLMSTLPQTGIKVWHLGLSLLLLAGGIVAVKKSGIGKKGKSEEDSSDEDSTEDTEYKPILGEESEDDEYESERKTLNEILEDPQNGVKDGENDER